MRVNFIDYLIISIKFEVLGVSAVINNFWY